MARPVNKRGFRPIVVGPNHYRWRFEGNQTADIEVHLEATSSARGQRLCVNFLCFLTAPITNALVSKLISEALALGWQPSQSGDDFRLELIEIGNDERPMLRPSRNRQFIALKNGNAPWCKSP